MALIRKNWQSQASGNATRAVCRVAGAGAAAYILAAIDKSYVEAAGNDDAQKTKKTIMNLAGPALTIAGVMGDLMFDDDKLRSLCQGLYSVSILKSAATISPDLGDMLGIRYAKSETELSGAIVNGPQILNATDEYSTDDTPEEILAIGEGASNDGNDWSAVADYVAEDADSAVQASTTSGLEAAVMNMI